MKEIIEYFNSYKEPQIKKLSDRMDGLKKKLDIEIGSCKERPKYEREILLTKARPLFDIETLMIQIKRSALEQEGNDRKRQKREKQEYTGCIVHSPHASANTESNLLCSSETKVVHNKDKNTVKSENLDSSSCSARNGNKLNEEIQNSKNSNGDAACRPLQTKTGLVSNLSTPDKEINGEKSLCMVQGKKKALQHAQLKNASQNIDNERRIELAMRFCSRSIKSSSQANSLKRLNPLMGKENMRKVLCLASHGFNSKPMKRKRDNSLSYAMSQCKPLSTANSVALSNGKRIKCSNHANGICQFRSVLR